MAMEFTKKFLRAKSPCADGFRWFSRHVEDGTGYQDALDTLVNAGRVEDACWLLTQFGPTNAVLTVDALEAEAIVFAGTVEVRGGIDVATVIQAGDVRADWGVQVEGDITCGGDLRAVWDVVCSGRLSLRGGAFVGQDLIAQGPLVCDKGLRVGGHLTAGDSVRAGQGMLVGGALSGASHLEAGWGIKAGECIHAQGAIKAGESLCAGEDICAGQGYGVFAGLNVQEDAWGASAQVWAQKCPDGLRSGVWSGPREI